MKVEFIAFTPRGEALAARMAGLLVQSGHRAACTREGLSARDWAARAFTRADALVFVGAAGIAVRACAPLLRHKSVDPAVVVADEGGHFVIPILSGHIGGANDLARELAALTGAQAVITTATDVNGVFAADQWARRQGLLVCRPEAIAPVSARLLAGGSISFWSRWPVAGPVPRGLVPGGRGAAELVVDWFPPEGPALWLCPRTLRVGLGCRRGASEGAIAALFQSALAQAGLPEGAVSAAASIDLKRDEAGLLAFCRGRGLSPVFYAPEELAQVAGDFTPSPFVEQVTGVDNVCERAALAEGGALLIKKTAGGGVTLALAGLEPNLDWRERP